MSEAGISRFIPRRQMVMIGCLIGVSVVDSVMVGYNSSLMGSLNVLPSYTNYFHLTTSTKSLNTGISYVGGALASLFAGHLADWRGRRETVFWACVIAIVGGIVQGAAQNIGMFIAGRFIVGMGMALAQTAAPVLVAETTPTKYRGFALGLYYACWGVGTLIASGVCYGTQGITTTWAWRIPSILQAAPGVCAIVILLFVPESPRWLISKDLHAEALEILQIVNDSGAEEVQVQYREIVDTIQFEKEHSKGVMHALSTKANRKKLLIVSTFSVIVMLPGTNLVTFYFGDMLSNAGIKDANTQLEVNIVLTSWTLVTALVSAWYTDALNRKTLCNLSLVAQIVTLFLLGGLTKLYGTSTNNSGIYGTISMIFFYNAFYAWGITPLTVLYPPEILSFDVRGVGMGFYTMTTKACGLFITMVAPFGLDAIGYQMYFVNACFNILLVALVYFLYVETRGLTLEEVDRMFEPEKRETVAEQVKEEIGVDIEKEEVLMGKI